MQELYLTKQQLKRLNRGVEVVLSRRGQELLISLKGVGVKRVRTAKKIEVLEARLAKLKAVVSEQGSPLNFTPCSVCKKPFARLDRHMAWKHDGVPPKNKTRS